MHRTIFAGMLFVLAACATATTPEQQAERAQAKAAEVFADDPRRGEEVKRLCFASSIDSFGETTKRAVVVREGLDHYLIETFGGCYDLDWAQSLAVKSFSGCLTRGDEILAFDSAFGPDRNDIRRPSCKVRAIYEWEEDADGREEGSTEETEEALETASTE
ncbi:MAG: DUF6491 family protein [Pseudomonadota bacterium]